MKNEIRKKYQTFDSVDQLLLAQKQIKKEYKSVEDTALTNVFDPIKIGMNVMPIALGLFRSKRKNRASEKAPIAAKSTQINQLLDATTPNKDSFHFFQPGKNKGLGKKMLSSFIRWQTIELAIWATGKIVKKIKL